MLSITKAGSVFSTLPYLSGFQIAKGTQTGDAIDVM